tara:strand:- start:349 stop:870 length:522 start_codon:yes stop_codon:yes gene_type:complete
MKSFKFLLIITYILCLKSSLNAEIPHYLDFKFILNSSTAGKKAQDYLKNSLEKGLKNITEKEKKILNEEKEIINQKKILSPEDYKKKVSELRKKVVNLQKERKTLLETVAKKRSKAKEALLKNLNPIVKDYMKEKKIRMVVDKKSILLADSNLDVTKDIMDLLNKKLKSINLD